ncbi:MAG: hypothetical protein QM605_02925 [Sphingobium sp.]
MSGVLIVKPLPLAAAPTIVGGGSGAAVTVDSFYLGYTNADAGAVWNLQTGTALGTGLVTVAASTPMRAADSEGPRHHCFRRLAAPVTSRYFRIATNQSGTVPLYIGALVIGLAFEKHREFGPGRTPIDTGTRQDLPSGGFGIGDGVVKSQFAFSFVDLTQSEKNRLWSIKKDRGLRKPVLLVEDAHLSEGLNDAIHYGPFERFQPYERARADRHSGFPKGVSADS